MYSIEAEIKAYDRMPGPGSPVKSSNSAWNNPISLGISPPMPGNSLYKMRQANFACEDFPEFILVAEFCEQEGPKPVIIIPSSGVINETKFDVFSFCVKILSTDHQASNSGPLLRNQDTELVISERHMSAYVLYFTLYDVYARGFVRPYCLSYVTSSDHLIMNRLSHIRENFSLISAYFKCGNWHVFNLEARKYLENLCFTRKHIKDMMEKYETDGGQMKLMFPRCSEPSAAASLIFTIDHIERDLHDLLNKIHPSDMSNIRSILEEVAYNSQNQDRKAVDVTNARKSMRRCLSWEPSMGMGVNRREAYETQPRKSMSETDLHDWTLDEETLPHKPEIIRNPAHRRFDHCMRNIHELCFWGAKLALNNLRQLYQDLLFEHLAAPSTDVWSRVLQFSPASVLTFGGCLMGDFSMCLPRKRPISTPGPCFGDYIDPNKNYKSQSYAAYRANYQKQTTNHRRWQFSTMAEHIKKLSLGNPGYGLCHISVELAAVLPHLVYCVLSGRPLLVMGSSDRAVDHVANIVKALEIFVPRLASDCGANVVQWATFHLSVHQLSTTKLLGMARPDTRPLPAAIAQQASVLNVEDRTLTSPAYSGTLLRQLHLVKPGKTDHQWAAICHSILLNICQKTLVYYECLLSGADLSACLEGLGISSFADEYIIKYLAELVKKEQVAEIHLSHSTDKEKVPPPVLHMDKRKCEKFSYSSRHAIS